MLERKKKLLAAITEWIDRNETGDSSWEFSEDEFVRVGVSNTAFNMWHKWRLGGQWPFGDWLSKPLSFLVAVDAIDMVYLTWKELRYNEDRPDPPRGMAGMNGTQLEIVRAFNG